ncbi:efflux RND transporter permease subunit [Poseidonocella sp. HB161398]|uniref:efflux RND transporter permease subunit n=1 Tax=Poseidonocella sp. HB161398 TaxID=2320855 RepID=UPI001107CF89|nr:efflux RND transporter permease subunit [Poseidonocella sp. HB161398]
MAPVLQISLPSLAGLATLAGVVVNGAILLLAFVKDRVAEGASLEEAVRAAVRDRFRAIALTAVAGLAPLLFEQNTQAQFLRPIVASLALGLASAAVLSLILAPAILLILRDLGLCREARPAVPGRAAPGPA